MTQETRSGLAAAAARLQLTDTPEGKSSLQIRLNEAEKRAHEAEVTAQDAQATLARTLLDAARVEAVVMARAKSESEAEIEALRSELEAVKRSAASCELLPAEARPDEARREEPHRLDAAAPEAVAPEAAVMPVHASYRPIRLTEWDRPLEAESDAVEAPEIGMAGWVTAPMLGLARVALPAVFAVVALASYDLTQYLMTDRGAVTSAAVARPSSDANWLLYMPVERAAVTQYLGGNARPARQLAVKSAPAAGQRN